MEPLEYSDYRTTHKPNIIRLYILNDLAPIETVFTDTDPFLRGSVFYRNKDFARKILLWKHSGFFRRQLRPDRRGRPQST